MANSIKFLIIASFCASCGTVSSVDSFGVFGPNGQEAYSMQCSGMEWMKSKAVACIRVLGGVIANTDAQQSEHLGAGGKDNNQFQ